MPRDQANERHASKLNKLAEKRDAANKDDTTKDDKKIINLSSHDLNNEEVKILKKGLGFAIAPKTVPIENIVCSVEDNIKNLSEEDKDAIRQDCTLVLKNAKPPKNNINKNEHEAIKNLRNNKNIVILKADKGGATIVMNRMDYNTKMREHLTTTGSYKKLENNPISKVIKEVKKAIKASNLDETMKKRLTPSCLITPRIYRLPKIHKEGVPLRPIVNTIGSPTYELAKYVARILGPLVGRTDSYIKDSRDFVELIKEEKIESKDMLISFDVVSLFTKIPLNEAIQVINEVADPQTTKLAEVCLKSTFFSFQGEFFEQTSGVAMGSPLSPIVANLYMEKFEKIALETYPLKPSRWKRYVDDTNVKWPHGKEELDRFFEHLNGISENIKFTMELEENNSIPFLDVLMIRKQDGTLGHKVFRKKTHTDSYLHADSHHHPSQKMGVLNTMATRAARISDKEHLEEEIDHLTRVFKNIGYRDKDIKKAMNKKDRMTRVQNDQTSNLKAFLPYIRGVTDKIAKVLKRKEIVTSFKPLITIRQRMKSVKDPIDQQQGKGIYKVSCSCGKCYIGETRRSFQVRIKEHEADIRNERTRTSALAEHSLKTKHHVCLEDTKILAKEDHYYKRRLREALEIIKHPNNMNRDGGLEVSSFWHPLINQLRDPHRSNQV
jgi:hypothetical protein